MTDVKETPAGHRPTRRDILRYFCATAATALTGSIASGKSANASRGKPACVARPQQTEGPYFVDARLNRSDIRSDPSDGSVKEGVPLRLTFHVSRIRGDACAPLVGAVVDVWQCDALGVYSAVEGSDTREKKFLRGYQTTDAGGVAQFVTIYPGWYPGRATHIHFKIRIDSPNRRGLEFVSQLYFDDAISDQIYEKAPYARRYVRYARNESDSLFRRGGDKLILALAKDAQGYAGEFDIGLQIA